jgi:hypothetical protein
MTWSDGAAGPSKEEACDAFASTVSRNRAAPKDGRLERAVASLLASMPDAKTRISTSGHLNPDGTGRVMICVTLE